VVAETSHRKASSIGAVSKQRLFVYDLLFIDHFSVAGDACAVAVAISM